jgi:Glycosyltransferases involved in cell wall biogenesis
MKDLTVVVLTHKRISTLGQTIKSILNQNCNDFIFVVSDNSGDWETYNYLQKQAILDRITYIHRERELSSLEHFNLVLSEIQTEYFILFHDDDVMCNNMIDILYKKINNSNYVAVGCNANYIIDNRMTKKRMLKASSDIIISQPDELFGHYAGYSIVPFPSYIYSRTKIGNTIFDNEVGKYSDVLWLEKLLTRGKILWTSRTLMYYRLHNMQDSSVYDYVGQLRLVKKILLTSNDRSKMEGMLYNYRIRMLYLNEISKLRTNNKINRNVYGLLLRRSPLYFFPRFLVRSVFLKRAYIKKYAK